MGGDIEITTEPGEDSFEEYHLVTGRDERVVQNQELEINQRGLVLAHDLFATNVDISASSEIPIDARSLMKHLGLYCNLPRFFILREPARFVCRDTTVRSHH